MIQNHSVFLLILFLFIISGCIDGNRHAIYKNPKNPISERVEDLIDHMTLEEKLKQLSGNGMTLQPNERLGIPGMNFGDGPFGVHNFGEGSAFGCGVLMASTWDTILVKKVASAVAEELKAYNVQCFIGPSLSIIRNPYGGRNFESFGEDPYLTGEIAVSFVKGCQNKKMAVCVKDYALGNQEWQNHNYDVIVDERTLREIYLYPYESVVQKAHVSSFMPAYNKVNDVFCFQSKFLLMNILKNDWEFEGFVISGRESDFNSLEPLKDGLDVWGNKSVLFHEQLLYALRTRKISEEFVNEKLRRLFKVMFELGLFDNNPKLNKSVLNSGEHNSLVRELERNGIVLLKNNPKLLPLNKDEIQTIAVIGPNAARLQYAGGGNSKTNRTFYTVSPLDGIKNYAGKKIKVLYTVGVEREEDLKPIESKYFIPSDTAQGKHGLLGEYFNNCDLSGKSVFCRLDTTIFFSWQGDPQINPVIQNVKGQPSQNKQIGEDNFSIRWTGKIIPPKTGLYCFKIKSDNGVRLFINNKLLIDNWWSHNVERNFSYIELTANMMYKIRIEYFENSGVATIQLGWQYHDKEKIKEAGELAKKADIAIVFAGLSDLFECEGYDRTTLELPGYQSKLIKEVVKANPRTIVVLNSGGMVLMNEWIKQVPSVLEAWYPGHEGGNAIADILFGRFNPCGKLPFSFLKDPALIPVNLYEKRSDRKILYSDGILAGYRYFDKFKVNVLFPFGYGLSYTNFHYDNLQVEQTGKQEFLIHVDISNTGETGGNEIIQLYVRDIESIIERPEKELKAFSKIFLKPDETKTITMKLDSKSFSYFDINRKKWVVEPGEYDILIGSSSKEIKLKKRIIL